MAPHGFSPLWSLAFSTSHAVFPFLSQFPKPCSPPASTALQRTSVCPYSSQSSSLSEPLPPACLAPCVSPLAASTRRYMMGLQLPQGAEVSLCSPRFGHQQCDLPRLWHLYHVLPELPESCWGKQWKVGEGASALRLLVIRFIWLNTNLAPLACNKARLSFGRKGVPLLTVFSESGRAWDTSPGQLFP